MIRQFINKTKEDIVFSISLILAIVTSLFNTPKLHYIDFKVLISLFNLMIVIECFEKQKLLEMISIRILDKFKNERKVSLVLILITFLFSMLITNDVALITFVPLALIIAKKSKINPMEIIVLQTLSANIGSSLTPMGNPQNLFIYSKYNLNLTTFLKIMLPFVILGLFVLVLLNLSIPNKDICFHIEKVEIKNKKITFIFVLLFIIVLLSIFNIINYYFAFLITVIITFTLDKKLFKEVDYALLLTFVFFFIFIGNLSNIEIVRNLFIKILNKPKSTFISSITLSQFISNVPCAILLSGFSSNYKELLLGVDIGGMGTLIASLASVISYKFYANEYKQNKKVYLKKFTVYNFSLLALFTIIFWFII
ncbi:SLC13 family permease [Caloramator proteoclasticus]|uniref:Transporter, YbiR family n=1 Tax=Caloramator proteoclasticus DSM 10124 TaxID=1121262 RepID=A0A1M5C3P1_9CLOT|nr:SLC13 family permease [Caloramator proteoclasticus]SHF49393.1 transporter, YbiR family [Caloramator proteoclasticus DSM 10124]